MIRRLAPLAGLLLSGCLFVSNNGLEAREALNLNMPALMNLEVLSLTVTHKTMFDHLATWVTGRDCSSPRAEREGVYCVDFPAPPAPPQQEYCYASLGRPTCYVQAYNEGNDRLLGFIPASPPVR
jgi:hypothetical protein